MKKLTHKLTQNADLDLHEIFLYTVEYFGEDQAFAYLKGLEKTFETLAGFPSIGKDVSEYSPGVRQFRERFHYVLYSTHDNHVLIERVIHTSRDVRKHISDM